VARMMVRAVSSMFDVFRRRGLVESATQWHPSAGALGNL
jgi:hypothetical protein